MVQYRTLGLGWYFQTYKTLAIRSGDRPPSPLIIPRPGNPPNKHDLLQPGERRKLSRVPAYHGIRPMPGNEPIQSRIEPPPILVLRLPQEYLTVLLPAIAQRLLHDQDTFLDARKIQEAKAAERRIVAVVVVADDKRDGVKDESAELGMQSLACQDEAGDVVATKGAAAEKGLDGCVGTDELVGLVGWEEVVLIDVETDFVGEEEEGGRELRVHFGRWS